jgi:hypothetical protein
MAASLVLLQTLRGPGAQRRCADPLCILFDSLTEAKRPAKLDFRALVHILHRCPVPRAAIAFGSSDPIRSSPEPTSLFFRSTRMAFSLEYDEALPSFSTA